MMLTEQCELWRRRQRKAPRRQRMAHRRRRRVQRTRSIPHEGRRGPLCGARIWMPRGIWTNTSPRDLGRRPARFYTSEGGSVGRFPEESSAHPRGREQGHGRFGQRRQDVGGRKEALSPSFYSDFELGASMLRHWTAIPGSWRPGSWKTAGS